MKMVIKRLCCVGEGGVSLAGVCGGRRSRGPIMQIAWVGHESSPPGSPHATSPFVIHPLTAADDAPANDDDDG